MLNELKITPKSFRAVGYLRVSVDEGGQNFTSIESQKKMIENYAIENGIDVVEYYIDDGISGYNFNDRPSFNKMCDDLNADEFDIIIAKDLSRIGRHNAYTLLFIEEVKRLGKRLILVNEGSGGYDTDKDEDDLLGIKSWYNEIYVKDISRKIKGNIRTQQKEGKFIIRDYYGYKRNPKDKHSLIIDENIAPVVRLIFKLYIEGNGYRKIASYLNDNGYLTPSQVIQKEYEEEGKVYKNNVSPIWIPVTVQRVIKNDVYTGVLRCGKTRRKIIKGKSQKVPDDEQFVFENQHPAIISEKEFELAQSISQKRDEVKYRGSIKYNNVFSGFLFCESCESFMVAYNVKNKPKSYICGAYHRSGVKACTSHRIREDKLIFIFQNHLKSIKLKLEDYIVQLNQEVTDKLEKKDNFNNVINRLKKELVQTNEELKVLIGQKVKDILKADEPYKSIIEEQYVNLEKDKLYKIKTLNEQINDLENLKNKSDNIEEHTKTALEIFNSIINKEIPDRVDIELIVDRIVVDKDGVPTFKLKDDIDSICCHNEVAVITYCIQKFIGRVIAKTA